MSCDRGRSSGTITIFAIRIMALRDRLEHGPDQLNICTDAPE